MRVVITGVPGVGKTSVCKGLEKYGYRIVNFGDVMFEIAKEKHGIEHRDEMRKKLNVSEYEELQREAAEKIGKMRNIIVDTHCSINVRGGYYPGLPARILEGINPHAIIIVEADIREIAKRRKKDAGIREREVNEEMIREHQEINRYYAAAYSAISGAPVFFVKNREGKLEETVGEIREIIEGL